MEKTLNRHVFTILKTCFLDLSIPFPLNPVGLSSLTVKISNFGKEEVRRRSFSSPTNHYLQPYSGVEDYELKEMIT